MPRFQVFAISGVMQVSKGKCKAYNLIHSNFFDAHGCRSVWFTWNVHRHWSSHVDLHLFLRGCLVLHSSLYAAPH